MGGYAINRKKAHEQVMNIFEVIKLQLDKAWRYDPHFLIGQETGRNLPNPQEHESKLELQKLANKNTFKEVKQTIKGE